MVTALRQLFASRAHPGYEDKEAAVQALSTILERAKAIGHAHASQEVERASNAWGGHFVSILNSSWAIVNTFVQRIEDWLSGQDDVDEADIEAEVATLADHVAGYEVAAAIEEEVMQTLAAQGVTLMVSIAQPDACSDCVDRANADPVPIGDFDAPPYHTHCRCSGAPAGK